MKKNSISYLIWMVFRRTARAKYLPWGAFFYCLFGFSALYTGLVKNEWFFVSIGYTIGSISVGLMIVLHVLRLLSVSFDGILVWPISSQNLLKGVSRVAHIITIGLYIPAILLVMFFNASILPHFLAAMLFSLFVVQPVYIRLMLFETNRYDVTKGMFATGDAMVSRPFLNNLATIGFAGLCIGLSWLSSQAELLNGLWLFFAISGGIGLLLSSSIRRNEVETFKTTRYAIANGFRKKMTIQINALRKTYGSFECSVDELFIESGQTIKLYGNNGAGKTTLLRLLLNLIPADGGDILVDGMSVVNDFDWRKKTAAYLDEGFQIPFLTVDEYLRFLLDVYGCPVPTELNLHQTYGGLIDQDFDPSVRVGKLSAGNRVKAGLLGVFMVTPSLLVLDEPFAHLDPRSKAGLISLIDSYRHDHPDATIILSSHDISITNRIVGRNLVMRKGQIIYDGMDHETSASEIESLLM